MKTTNKCSFVNVYNVKASTGKQETHSNHNVGWFSHRYRWHHFWKSPGVAIPGVWVIFAENLQMISAGKLSHRWHWQLARQPRFVLF